MNVRGRYFLLNMSIVIWFAEDAEEVMDRECARMRREKRASREIEAERNVQ